MRFILQPWKADGVAAELKIVNLQNVKLCHLHLGVWWVALPVASIVWIHTAAFLLP